MTNALLVFFVLTAFIAVCEMDFRDSLLIQEHGHDRH